MGQVTVAKGTAKKAVRQPGMNQASKTTETAKNPHQVEGGSGNGETGDNTQSGKGNAMLSGVPVGSGGEKGLDAGRGLTDAGRGPLSRTP